MNDQRRGDLAQALLENEVLQMALDVIEREVIALWEQTPVRDREGKEELWRLYKTSKKFRGVLLGYVQAGKLERLKDPTPIQKMSDFFTRKAV